MRATQRLRTLAAILAVAGAVELVPASAQAQSSYVPNTYADYPYNQGSLFYRPLGANASKNKSKSVLVNRRRAAVPQQQYYYPQQQGATTRQMYYNPQTRQYYYAAPR